MSWSGWDSVCIRYKPIETENIANVIAVSLILACLHI